MVNDDDDAEPIPPLVAAALDGDAASWHRLVERYTPVALSVVRRFRLQGSDADDVVQIVWLRLVEKLGAIREPEALPGWIVTTTRRECLHVLRARRNVSPTDLNDYAPADGTERALDSDLLEAERHEALLAALAELPDRQRNLLLLLLEDPPLSYEEVSVRLDMPVGSIGPTRARALAHVRASRAMQALLNA